MMTGQLSMEVAPESCLTSKLTTLRSTKKWAHKNGDLEASHRDEVLTLLTLPLRYSVKYVRPTPVKISGNAMSC